ncbi:unnamed protein product [Orchesella dallaii]|uniref:Gustatory receptor n=1 Tax=Orchesella dallaii TaxID=48710 RepID=A0ABP1R6Y2_9HEXA
MATINTEAFEQSQPLENIQIFSNQLSGLLRHMDWVIPITGIVSGRFNRITRSYKYDATLSRRVRWNYVLKIFSLIVGLYKLAMDYMRKDVNRLNVGMAFWLAALLGSVLHSVLYWFLHDICIMTNGFHQFIVDVNRKFGKSRYQFKTNETKYLVIFLKLMSWYAFTSYIFVTVLVIYNPRGAPFLGNLVPIKYYRFPIPILLIIFHSYVYSIDHTVYNMTYLCIVIYSFYFIPILVRELRIGRKSYRMQNSLRKPENIQHIYRCLQLLDTNVFCAVGPFLLVCNAIFMLTVIYCNFVLIKYWDQLDRVAKGIMLAWAFILSVFWASVLELGRFQYLGGNKVIKSWQRGKWGSERENKMMKKFAKRLFADGMMEFLQNAQCKEELNRVELQVRIFAIYVDDIYVKLARTGLGCHGHPAACQDVPTYATEHSISFNPTKTYCQAFVNKSMDTVRPIVRICGKNIALVDSVKYLGYTVN